MDCFSPVWLHSEQMFVPCGRCNFCLQSRRLDWAFRIQREQKNSISSNFITLTYADEYIPIEPGTGTPQLDKSDLQKFFKRLRKINEKYSRKAAHRIRYYAVGEYGSETKRPHYHIILFNAQRKTIERLDSAWKIGNIHKGRCTPSSIGYVAGYTINDFDINGTIQKPFSVMSRRPGIGANYISANGHYHRGYDEQGKQKFYIVDNGTKRRLPRYYKDRIFTREEKEAYNTDLEVTRNIEREAEYARLAKYNSDPYNYYQMCRTYSHDLIAKMSKKNKFL